MNFYLLNSPVLSNWGHFEFEGPIDLAQARAAIPTDYVSAIGHHTTADMLSQLLQINVPMNRAKIVMHTGDVALVFRLKQRPPEGVVLDQEQLDSIGYEFGLLRCHSALAGSATNESAYPPKPMDVC